MMKDYASVVQYKPQDRPGGAHGEKQTIHLLVFTIANWDGE